MKLLALSGAALILLSIATGWLIIAKKYLSLGIIESIIHDDKKIVKAHIDYIMMGIILFVFFLTGVNLPFPVIVLSCIGAFADPSLFIFLSIKPDVNKKIGSAFSVISTITFLITTAGIGGGALYIFMDLMK